MVNVLVSVYAASGHTRVDQPLYVEKGRLLAVVPWDPDGELMCEALALFGFGQRDWIGGNGTFRSLDEQGEVDLIAEVE